MATLSNGIWSFLSFLLFAFFMLSKGVLMRHSRKLASEENSAEAPRLKVSVCFPLKSFIIRFPSPCCGFNSYETHFPSFEICGFSNTFHWAKSSVLSAFLDDCAKILRLQIKANNNAIVFIGYRVVWLNQRSIRSKITFNPIAKRLVSLADLFFNQVFISF